MSVGHKISGTASLALRINGQMVPPVANFMKEFTIYSGFGHELPAIGLHLSDQQNLLVGGMALTDGTVIDLIFGKEEFTSEISTTVLKITTIHASNAIEFKVVAVLNMPKYTFGGLSECYNGTSIDALTEIMESVGVEVDSDVTTSDKMKWLNVNHSKMRHVKQILKHSYQSDNAIIYGMLTDDKRFIIRDLFKLIQKEPDYTVFVGGVSDSNSSPDRMYTATEIKPESASGLMNMLTNYGNAYIQPRMSGEIDTFDKVNPPVLGDGLPINQDIQESMQYSRMAMSHYYDPGIGEIGGSNAHENYYKAAYQNLRYLSLFNQCVRVLIDGDTTIQLFDVIDLRVVGIIGIESVINESHSGKYIVGGRTVVKRGNHYTQIFDLYRCYVTESGNTPVLGSKNQKPSVGKPKSIAAENSVVNFKDPTGSADIAKQTNTNIRAAVNDPSKSTDYIDQFNTDQKKIQSEMDIVIDKATAQIDALEESFKQEAQDFGLDELTEKYGQSKDKLNSLMDEFGAAKSTLEQCGKLSPLEKLSVNLAKANIGKLMKAVTSRIDRVDSAIVGVQNDINSLIQKGDIQGALLDDPSIRTNCKQFQTDHMNAAISDRYPDKCVDQYALDRLRLPTDRLRRLKRKLESYLRNLFCMIGEE